MHERDDWGPWIEPDGKGCPCVGMWVRMESKGCTCRHIAEGMATDCEERGEGFEARCHVCGADTISQIGRYRVRRPRALLNLIDMVENLPAPARKREDA